MNFFPNLQIHVYASDENNTNPNRTRRSRISTPTNATTTGSTSSTNLLQGLLQSLRRGAVDMVNTGVSTDDDMQIYVGYETLIPNASSTSTSATPAPVVVGLQMQELNQYTELFVNEDTTTDATICSICRSNFVENEICRKITNCNHYFHQTCVDSWLVRNQTCPMCRNLVIPRS
jgi:hypothetical protein